MAIVIMRIVEMRVFLGFWGSSNDGHLSGFDPKQRELLNGFSELDPILTQI